MADLPDVERIWLMDVHLLRGDRVFRRKRFNGKT
jgi:hypothetical protein